MAKKKLPGKRSPDLRKRVLNQRFIDKAYIATKKILESYTLDPAIFDRLSKQQRAMFLCVETELPKFKVAEGSRVPRQLLKMVNASLQHFLRNNYYLLDGSGPTYLELATFGISLYTQVMRVHEYPDDIFSPEQQEVVETIAEKFLWMSVNDRLGPVVEHIQKTIQMISKVNFRVYGFHWQLPSEYGRGYLKSTITLYSDESEATYFRYKGTYHKAFRVRAGRVITLPPLAAVIDHREVFPNRHGDKDLEIYIQSHALQRVKERIDIFPAHKRNFYAMYSLLYNQDVVTDTSGQPMFRCYYEDTTFGYYPFIVQKDKIFILTFLPLMSPVTPVGAMFTKRFGLQKEDIRYLGMDQLAFFFTVDLMQLHLDFYFLLDDTRVLWLLYFAPEDRLPFEIDPQKTRRVKEFFEKANIL
jgi:hypothetical protein